MSAIEHRPYHHGDLRRGLVEAARRVLEAQGPAALSLRAVAREAGVSPAAPYHHFKDKGELLDAVAEQGWGMLSEVMTKAMAADGELRVVVLAYVCFALEHPALYRVMYDAAREKESLPFTVHESEDSAYAHVRDMLVKEGAAAQSIDLELATVAAWCSAHGLAEMAGFRHFDHLKEALGGDVAFLDAVLKHLGLFAGPKSPC